MMRKLFGTDGIRGTANSEPMTADTALKVAMAAGRLPAPRRSPPSRRHRQGHPALGLHDRAGAQAGFIAVGMDVVLVGPLPTPAIAMLTRSLRADLGVMISASHNRLRG